MGNETAQPIQQHAEQLLHQQLQLLTVDTESNESVLLRKLLRMCSVAMQLMAALARSAEAPASSRGRQVSHAAVTGDKLINSLLTISEVLLHELQKHCHARQER